MKEQNWPSCFLTSCSYYMTSHDGTCYVIWPKGLSAGAELKNLLDLCFKVSKTMSSTIFIYLHIIQLWIICDSNRRGTNTVVEEMVT